MENSFSHNNYNKICCFTGHSSIFGKEDLPEKLKKEIVNLIENHDVNTFYSGDKGDFDWRWFLYCIRYP